MLGGATQAMSVYIVEERQRRRCPRAARNPKGAWGLRAISALLVVNDVHRHRRRLAL
jgi:hypothetical protein